MDQNLSLYKIFFTVANTKNISKAAKELYISQPAISKSISRLEDNLGCKLFIRNSRGVALTDEGSILYSHISNAFFEINNGERQLKQINKLGIGQIKIGVSTTLCKYMLLPYLNAFVQKFPHVKITITCQSSLHTLKLLNEGQIDVGLIGLPEHTKNIEFIPVGQVEDIFVTTTSYLTNLSLRTNDSENFYNDFDYLSTSEGIYSLFKNANIMLLDEENITRHYIDDYFKKNSIIIDQALEVSTMDLLIEFSKIGLGVACVIKEFVKKDLSSNTLVEIPLPHKTKGRYVGFAYSKIAPMSHSLTDFINFCKTNIPI